MSLDAGGPEVVGPLGGTRWREDGRGSEYDLVFLVQRPGVANRLVVGRREIPLEVSRPAASGITVSGTLMNALVDAPLAGRGVQLAIRRASGGKFETASSTQTDTQGRFRFENVAATDACLASNLALLVDSGRSMADFTVIGGQERLGAGTQVSQTVWDMGAVSGYWNAELERVFGESVCGAGRMPNAKSPLPLLVFVRDESREWSVSSGHVNPNDWRRE